MAKKALLIGVSQYESGLPPLAAAPKDVAAMWRVLESPDLGAFDEVKTLIDPDLEAMQTAIDLLFQSCQKGDLGLLYFSGHGITDDSDRLYLATRRTSKDTFRSTAVSASFIHGIMRDRSYQRQHVLILDCCYSGAFAEGWLAKSVDINLKPQLEVEGSVVLTSSTSTQKSYEDKEGELSLYTNYIVQGIESGAAESDGDGFISADELHEYAKRYVQSAKPAMKPEIYGIRQGIKIRLAKARVDTKLEYRRLVERYAENGEISFVGQDILEVQRDRWGLSDEVAIAIENEVLEPVRKRLKNLERYEKSLERACKQQFPLTERIVGQLKDLQEVLGLRDEDVLAIQKRVIDVITEDVTPEIVRRRFEAAMPQKSKAGQRTEVRAMVSLENSIGLRGFLPSLDEGGLLIRKEDTIQNNFPLEFPIDLFTSKLLSVNIYLHITAPNFNVEEPTKQLTLYPKMDSGVVTFFLTPYSKQQYGRVRLELFKDKDKTILLSSLSLTNEIKGQEDNVANFVWQLVTLWVTTKNSSYKHLDSNLGQQREAEIRRQIELELEGQRLVELERKRLRYAEQERLKGQLEHETEQRTQEQENVHSKIERPNSLELPKLPFRLSRRNFILVAGFSGVSVVTFAAIRGNQTPTSEPKPFTVETGKPFKIEFENGVNLDMVYIPSGKFNMGSPPEEKGDEDERPQIKDVNVSAFYMGKYEVTKAQWQAIMENNPSKFKDNLQNPVEPISRDEAQEFCKKLSQKTGKEFRLPSEAEWEYACRAGTTTAYSFGDNASLLSEYAWYTDNSGSKTHPVGQKKPNPWGLYDMHGNVWEWCQDSYEKYGGESDLIRKTGKPITKENNNRSRLLRGGSWNNYARDCRSAYRYDFGAIIRLGSYGFRVVCVVT